MEKKRKCLVRVCLVVVVCRCCFPVDTQMEIWAMTLWCVGVGRVALQLEL